jgi:MFS family permease
MLTIPGGQIWGRICEGLALALGTVVLFSTFRIISYNEAEYKKNVSHVILSGGLGFIIGPMFAYTFMSYGVDVILKALLLINILAISYHLFFTVLYKIVPKKFKLTKKRKSNVNYYFIGSLFLIKFLQIGMQPNITWWNKNIINLSHLNSGLVFILMGIGFILGAVFSKKSFLYTVFIGIIAFELSLHSLPFLYAPSLFLLSFWFGSTMTDIIAELGFGDVNQLGVRNSIWLLISDLSLFIGPAILWECRYENDRTLRIILLVTLSSFTLISYLFGKRKASLC